MLFCEAEMVDYRNVAKEGDNGKNKHLMPEEQARIIEIQDLLIDRYVEQKEAMCEGNRCRAIELEFEIKELLHEKEKIRG